MYWNTVDDQLRDSLLTLMEAPELIDFRLVGGTALSLHLGHRISVDIDLFTDKPYGTVDFTRIESMLAQKFPFIIGDFGGNPGMGKSYRIGTNAENAVKLDIYYSMDPFFQPFILEDGVRIASVEEILAMKIDVVLRGGRKKDFWDLHELLTKYTINNMILLHNERFQWTHNRDTIIKNLVSFDDANEEPNPICLKNKEWIFIMEDIENAVANR